MHQVAKSFKPKLLQLGRGKAQPRMCSRLPYRDFVGQPVLNTGIIRWAHFAEGSPMKAPKYQRAEMLNAALQEAVQTLEDPVEGLEITDKGVVAWAAGRFILISYHWDNDYGADGVPLLGSGAWSARYVVGTKNQNGREAGPLLASA